MKTTLLLLAATLTLTTSWVHAKPASFPTATVPQLSLTSTASDDVLSSPSLSGRGSDFAAGLHQTTSAASFADLNNASKSVSLPPTWVLALLVAAGVLACRIFGLNHAREMADHELNMHRAKAKMYHSLQKR